MDVQDYRVEQADSIQRVKFSEVVFVKASARTGHIQISETEQEAALGVVASLADKLPLSLVELANVRAQIETSSTAANLRASLEGCLSKGTAEYICRRAFGNDVEFISERIQAEQYAWGQEVASSLAKNCRKLQFKLTGVAGIGANPQTISVGNQLDSDRVVEDYFSSVPLVSRVERGGEAAVASSREQIARSFKLFEKLLKNELVQSFHIDELYELLKVCHKWAAQVPQKVILRVGFGASEDAPSPRLCSYVGCLKSFFDELAEGQREGWLSDLPEVNIIFAHKVGAEVNLLSSEGVKEVAASSVDALQRFLHEFAPDLLEHVTFSSDEAIDYSISEEVVQDLLQGGFSVDLMTRLEKQALRMQRKGLLAETSEALSKCVTYALAHTSIFEDVILAGSVTPESPDAVISFGGRGEVLFGEVRREFSRYLKERLGAAVITPSAVRVIQAHGDHPPYYHLEGVDTPLDEFDVESFPEALLNSDSKTVRKSVARDLHALRELVLPAYRKHADGLEAGIKAADSKLKRHFAANSVALQVAQKDTEGRYE